MFFHITVAVQVRWLVLNSIFSTNRIQHEVEKITVFGNVLFQIGC